MKSYSYITIIVALFIYGCGDGGKKEAAEKAKQDSLAKVKNYDLDPEQAVGIGRVEPEMKIVKLYPETSGPVEKLFVKAGDEIRRGQIICALGESVEAAKIDKIKAQISSQESLIQAQETQVRSQETQVETQQTQINGFDKDIAKAQVAVNLAQKNFNRTKDLYEKGAETKAAFDNVENQLQTALAEVERLQAQKANLKAQQENLRAQKDNLKATQKNLQSKIGEFKADMELAEVERSKRAVHALSDGKILSVDITLGSYIAPNVAIGDFAPASPVNVITEIDELFAPKVKVGQAASLRLQGSSKEIATGKVIEVAPYLKQKSLFSDEAGKLEDRRVREVRVRLDNPPADILYGMRVDCVIDLK